MRDLNKRYIIMIIIFIFTTPRFFYVYEPISMIGKLTEYSRYIISLAAIALYFSNLKISKYILALLIFYTAYLISVLYNNGDIIMYAKQMITIIGLSVILEYYIKNYTKEFVYGLFYILFTYTLINLVCLIVKPEGFATLITYSNDRIFNQTDRVNFLEVDNRIIMTLLPLIAISNIYKEQSKYGYVMCKLAILISILTEIIVWSATGIISISVMLVYILLIKNKKVSNLFKFRNLIIIHFITISIVLFASKINVIEYFVTEVLNKDMTFSGRTFIWESVFEYIKKSPILGYGNFNNGWIIFWRGIARNAHNFYLDILIQGGIVLLISFIIIMMNLGKKLNKLYQTRYANLMSILVMSMLTYLIGESNFFHIYLCLILGMASNVRYFNELK